MPGFVPWPSQNCASPYVSKMSARILLELHARLIIGVCQTARVMPALCHIDARIMADRMPANASVSQFSNKSMPCSYQSHARITQDVCQIMQDARQTMCQILFQDCAKVISYLCQNYVELCHAKLYVRSMQDLCQTLCHNHPRLYAIPSQDLGTTYYLRDGQPLAMAAMGSTCTLLF